ncbi:partial demethylmenaquinone methyltransferase / 2-methoxy-6-polyprenyl-1,4-benzoquinol methylase, partial [Rhodocyclaceae bacterium]
LALPATPRVLEIGCGTGHLTRALAPAIGGTWTVTDIAPAMVEECARCCGTAGIAARFAVMDGEHPDLPAGGFDLVVSSLAAQWFEDLPGALAAWSRLLAPGGCIALATLGKGSFAEWQTAHADVGLSAATHAYPDAAGLARSFPQEMEADVAEETLAEPFAAPIDFLRRLRAIGADTPAAGTRPLSAGQLRRVMKALTRQGAASNGYRLLYATARRPA